MLKFLVPLILSLVLAAPASAVTLVTPDGHVAQPFQRWANKAAVPTPPGTVVTNIKDGCPSTGTACASRDYMWVAFVDLYPPGFYHELGHVYDFRVLTPALRHRFAVIMQHPWADWWHGNLGHMEDGYSPLGEWFAEGYSLCAARIKLDPPYGWGYNYNPTQDQQRQVCHLIRHSGGWFMTSGGTSR